MKHVFGIASHLTFHMANRIIQTDKIPLEDCYFLMLRNYTIPDEYRGKYTHQLSTPYNIDVNHGRVFNKWSICQTNRNIRAFDALIDEFTNNDEYIWYTSVCDNDICSLMVTRKQCGGYYVMEDGLVSYEPYNRSPFSGWKKLIYYFLLKPLFPRIFALKANFVTTNHPKFKGCLASSKLCFPLHQQYLRVVGPIFEPQEYSIRPDAIISIDQLYFRGVSDEQVEQVYRTAAEYMKGKNYRCIAYKLHPQFNAASNVEKKELCLKMLANVFPDSHELPADVVLEKILLWSKADFYSCDSSVVLYVHESGVKCYSMMSLLEGTPAYFNNAIMRQISQSIKC